MSRSLSAVLDEVIAARLASPRSFERGETYVHEGRVGPLRQGAGRVAATVHGAGSYAVELCADDGGLRFSCSCPVGLGGEFCKHCVAVTLSWLEGHGTSPPTLDDARAYLETLPPHSLVELLIDHAHDDERLARRLLLMAARPPGGAPSDGDSLRALIDRAFAHRGFVPYGEAWGYAQGIEELVDVLDGLLEDGRADDVVGLAEYALAAAERSIEHVDDSDGHMGGVVERLEALHLDACRRGEPDGVALAQRLFVRELEGDWDVFHRAVLRYADVLGEAGLARYRELARARWDAVRELAPGAGSHDRYGSRLRITRIMETLADLSGSLAEQVAVRERDLSSPYRFLQVAELCRSHGDDDAALAWAERGVATFAQMPDPRLRSFLVDEYRRRGRNACALEHSWAAFAARPSLETYREVAQDARALDAWTERREAAVALLRGPHPGSGETARHPRLRDRGRSELVRVHLWEDEPETAWVVAGEGGCSPALWLELADRRRAEHPEDALTVYRRHVEATIAGKNRRAYAAAVRLIDETIRALFGECGRPADFDTYVEDVRTAHRAKRNLLTLMEGLIPTHAA